MVLVKAFFGQSPPALRQWRWRWGQKKKESKMGKFFIAAVVLVLSLWSAGAQASIRLYQHMGTMPAFAMSQATACSLPGVSCPAYLQGIPVEQKCKAFWLRDGSILRHMAFGANRISRPGEEYKMALGSPRKAYLCIDSNGTYFGKFEARPDNPSQGFGNYIWGYASELVYSPVEEEAAPAPPVAYYQPQQQEYYAPVQSDVQPAYDYSSYPVYSSPYSYYSAPSTFGGGSVNLYNAPNVVTVNGGYANASAVATSPSSLYSPAPCSSCQRLAYPHPFTAPPVPNAPPPAPPGAHLNGNPGMLGNHFLAPPPGPAPGGHIMVAAPQHFMAVPQAGHFPAPQSVVPFSQGVVHSGGVFHAGGGRH